MAKVREHTARMNESIRVQEVKACLLCGNEGVPLYQDLRDRLFGAPGTWSLMRCPKCQLIWLHPRSLPSDIGKIYDTYYTHSMKEDRKPRLASLRKKIKRALLVSSFGYDSLLSEKNSMWAGKALGLLPPLRELVGTSIMWLDGRQKGKLLDVGCGSGRFLATMQELGWDVLGVEPDAQAGKVARERLGIRVLIGTLEEAGLPDNSFDAVTISHVLEHVPDPIGFLKKCLRVLKPGGRLVVVTPNVESLGHKVFRESWRGLEPPRHLHIFSLQTLGVCAERAGLQVKILRTTARSARGMWVASMQIQRNGKPPNGPLKSFGWLLRFGGATFQLLQHGLRPFRKNIGEEIILIVSKE